ncbi:MAG: glycosyltransferase [Candidatus Jordarchaeaceae archaeon]
MGPLFSVIIPTYNEEKMIGGLLQELAKVRKKQKIEIIVSDGKSVDNTVQVAKRYGAKIIVAQSNIASAKNYGALIAKGKILVFLDADVRFKNVDGFLAR